uniref:Col_cuticle_N domain-containing protein n=1 Tax=Caenorhabditis japonica TaxID=281687 RepID=A0A8R1EXH6_CAEJA
MVNSRKAAYQTVLVIAATLSVLSIIVIFSTFPFFYTYFARVKMELARDMRNCKKSAENMFNFVNKVEYYDPFRKTLLDVECTQNQKPRSFLLQ